MNAIDTMIEAFAYQQPPPAAAPPKPPPTHVEFTVGGARAAFPASEVHMVFTVPESHNTTIIFKSPRPALSVHETHDQVLKLLGWNPARAQ